MKKIGRLHNIIALTVVAVGVRVWPSPILYWIFNQLFLDGNRCNHSVFFRLFVVSFFWRRSLAIFIFLAAYFHEQNVFQSNIYFIAFFFLLLFLCRHWRKSAGTSHNRSVSQSIEQNLGSASTVFDWRIRFAFTFDTVSGGKFHTEEHEGALKSNHKFYMQKFYDFWFMVQLANIIIRKKSRIFIFFFFSFEKKTQTK